MDAQARLRKLRCELNLLQDAILNSSGVSKWLYRWYANRIRGRMHKLRKKIANDNTIALYPRTDRIN